MPDVVGEAFIQFLRFRLEQADLYCDSGGAQLCKSLARNLRIRILHGADHAMDSGGDHGIGARAGASLMRARFQIEIESSAAGACARLLEREDFGVLTPS